MSAHGQGQATVFTPSRTNKKCWFWLAGLFVAGCAAMTLALLFTSELVGAMVFCVVGALVLLLAAHSLSVSVEVGSTEVTYRSIFGCKVLQLHDVESALTSSIRGVTFLTIKAGKKYIQCYTYTYSIEQITNMQKLVEQNCKKLSKAVVTTYPPITEKSMAEFLMIYLFLISAGLAIIVFIGIHHLHTRGLR